MKKVMVYLGKTNREQSIELIHQTSDTILANYNQALLVEADNKGIQTLQSKGFRIREISDSPIVQIGGYKVDTESPNIKSASSSLSSTSDLVSPTGMTHQILHLIGPILQDWKKQLEDLGVVFRQSLVQENYYLISVDNNKIFQVQQLPFVQSLVPYYPNLKVNPVLLTQEVHKDMRNISGLSLVNHLIPKEKFAKINEDFNKSSFKLFTKDIKNKIDEEKDGNLELLLFDQKDQKAVIESINKIDQVKIINTSLDRIIVFADPSMISQLAAIPFVREINPHNPKILHNNIAREIINVDEFQNPVHLDGKNQVVAIADTGLDTGINNSNICADFKNQIINIFALGRPGNASDVHGHGTHVAGSVIGNGSNSNRVIKGVAPSAKLVFLSIMDSNRGLDGIPSDLGVGLFDVAQNNGAKIINNSWSDTQGTGAYDGQCRQADSFAFKTEIFSYVFRQVMKEKNKHLIKYLLQEHPRMF